MRKVKRNCTFRPQTVKCQRGFYLDVTKIKGFFFPLSAFLSCPHPTLTHLLTLHCSPGTKGLKHPEVINHSFTTVKRGETKGKKRRCAEKQGRDVMLRKSRGRDVSGSEVKGVRGGRRTNSGRGEQAVTGEERVSQDRREGEEERRRRRSRAGTSWRSGKAVRKRQGGDGRGVRNEEEKLRMSGGEKTREEQSREERTSREVRSEEGRKGREQGSQAPLLYHDRNPESSHEFICMLSSCAFQGFVVVHFKTLLMSFYVNVAWSDFSSLSCSTHSLPERMT